jgi:hypothetical protein
MQLDWTSLIEEAVQAEWLTSAEAKILTGKIRGD